MMHAGQRPNESAGEERSRPAGNRRQRVLWCGPSDGEFHWLLQRINRGDWQVVLRRTTVAAGRSGLEGVAER